MKLKTFIFTILLISSQALQAHGGLSGLGFIVPFVIAGFFILFCLLGYLPAKFLYAHFNQKWIYFLSPLFGFIIVAALAIIKYMLDSIVIFMKNVF